MLGTLKPTVLVQLSFLALGWASMVICSQAATAAWHMECFAQSTWTCVRRSRMPLRRKGAHTRLQHKCYLLQ